MLLRFAVTNHLSIKDRAEVNFVATSLKEHASGLVPSRYARHGVLPVVAIYGANASGKSNLLISLVRLRSLVLQSFARSEDESGLKYEPFCLDLESAGNSTHFELDFSMDDVRYQFGVSYDQHQITAEWLYSFPKQIQKILYRRDSESEYYFGRALSGSNRQIQSITKKNTLFISAAAKAGHPLLSKVSDYFKSKIRVQLNSDHSAERIATKLYNTPELAAKVANYLSMADTGVTEVKVETTPVSESHREELAEFSRAILKFTGAVAPNFPEVNHSLKLGHSSSDGIVRFIDFGDESLGTKYLFGLLPAMIESLQDGGTLVLDEITTSLHTLLAKKLVSLFNDRTTNPLGAQLVFTTHDTNLLAPGLLRRDEILLAEKSIGGASAFFPLSDIKTKNTDNIERGYIQGRFGAIPYIDEISIDL